MLQVVISPEMALTVVGSLVASALGVAVTGWRILWYLKSTFLLLEQRVVRLEENQQEDRTRVQALEQPKHNLA